MKIWTRDELIAEGMNDWTIVQRVGRAELVRLRPGMFATGDAYYAAGDPERHAAFVEAAQTRIRRTTVASHESCLRLHGVSVLAPAISEVTVTTAQGHPKRYQGLVVQVAQLPNEHVLTDGVLGLPSTTVPRGVVDIARLGTRYDGLVAADSALHLMACSKDELLTVAAACREWPGGIQAERICNLADGLVESAGESISRVMFMEHGVPAPNLQVWIATSPGQQPDCRVDFLWRDRRVVGEFDGLGKYDDPEEKPLELEREERLRRAGFVIVRWGWDDVMLRAAETAAKIRAALAESAA